MESLGLSSGFVYCYLIDKQGNVVEAWGGENVITDMGKEKIITTLSPIFAYIGIGTGTTPAGTSDRRLDTEIGTRMPVTVTYTGNVIRCEAEFDAGNGTGLISEMGVFDSYTDGNMIARKVYTTARNKSETLGMRIVWELTTGASV
jgi:hypothetical protein